MIRIFNSQLTENVCFNKKVCMNNKDFTREGSRKVTSLYLLPVPTVCLICFLLWCEEWSQAVLQVLSQKQIKLSNWEQHEETHIGRRPRLRNKTSMAASPAWTCHKPPCCGFGSRTANPALKWVIQCQGHRVPKPLIMMVFISQFAKHLTWDILLQFFEGHH